MKGVKGEVRRKPRTTRTEELNELVPKWKLINREGAVEPNRFPATKEDEDEG
ncbi:hypothetical protein FACS1894151_07670 [Spirochaetia bacterium]|nr:hypothetical protein FACS1894151_07670 [Spirochaetia bacterium]